MTSPARLLFLPGASGDTGFWAPAAELIDAPAERILVGYPGFGGVPRVEGVDSLDDLVDLVAARLTEPTALIAQSMGGILAVRAALRHPSMITHLVLTATSGGVDMAGLGAADWRDDYRSAYAHVPDWFVDERTDLTAEIGSLTPPTLLLWGDADPISPVAVGEHLAELLSDARLHVVAGGAHDLAHTHAAEIAPLISAHLAR